LNYNILGKNKAMSQAAKAIWSKAPKTIRESTTASLFLVAKEEYTIGSQQLSQQKAHLQQQQQQQKQQQQQQQKEFPKVIPAGQKCRHGKWQPEPAETELAKAWTCYDCAFECTICGLTSVGLCNTYECRNV